MRGKATISPTEEQEAELRALWFGPDNTKSVLARASALLGGRVTYHNLRYRFGNRAGDAPAPRETVRVPADQRRPRGRPGIDVTPEQDRELRALWFGPYTWPHVEREAARIMGRPVGRGTFFYQYGPRSKSSPAPKQQYEESAR